MRWQDIREAYPDQWLVVEALMAHTVDEQRHLDDLLVVASCADGAAAMQRYRALHQRAPERELYYLHTSRAEPDIRVRQWLGVRLQSSDLTA